MIADSGAVEVTSLQQTTTSRRTLRRLVRQPVTMLSLAFLGVLAIASIFASWIAPYSDSAQDLERTLEGPSSAHWLGTDQLGRDTLSRLIYGSRLALQSSLEAALVAALIGITIGLIVGYRGGWTDRLVMRVVDAGDAFPSMVLAFAVIAVLGASVTNAMVAVGLIFIPGFVRLTRALVLVEREKLYVDAARVEGARTRTILFREILPNAAPPLIVRAALAMAAALLIESSLTYLGLGGDVSQASWGGMLNTGTQLWFRQPLLPWPPGLAITFTVLAFNLVGDGLRDALGDDRRVRPHLERRRIGRGLYGFLVDRRRPAMVEPERRERPEPAAIVAPGAFLTVDDLAVTIRDPARGDLSIIEGVSFELGRGETLGIVGESGSGKTMTGLALMGLLPAQGYVSSGAIALSGKRLDTFGEREYRRIRGGDIAMVFQDPLAALSPVHTIGQQIVQSLRNGGDISRRNARRRAAELLQLVGIDDPERLADYPHQFSGGMAQRVVIAIALAREPQLLVADEPTTALDVTIQRQILDLLHDLQERLEMAIILISHDFGVIAHSCERAIVMYAGQIVEEAPVADLLTRPRHPYTSALLVAMPRGVRSGSGRLPTIEGIVPPAWAWPSGCRFHPRCPLADRECTVRPIELRDGVRCVRPLGESIEPRRDRRAAS